MRNSIKVHLVKTENMMADDKTKALQDRAKFIKCRAFQLNIPYGEV